MSVLVFSGKNYEDGGIQPKKGILQREFQEILHGVKQEHHPRDFNEGEEEAMREGELEEAAVYEHAGKSG